MATANTTANTTVTTQSTVNTTTALSSTIRISPLDLNVNSAKYRLVFETNSGKISIDNANDPTLENLSTGVVAFNISKKDSESIVQSSNRTVYLVSVSQDGRETLMYTGEWRLPSEQADVDAAITAAKEDANTTVQYQSSLNEINQNIKNQEVAQSTLDLNKNSSTKNVATPSVVNTFGVKESQSIIPNSNNS